MTFPLIKLDCGIFSFSGSPNRFPQIVNVIILLRFQMNGEIYPYVRMGAK